MDTDDLSTEAYEAVIAGSERFHHDLTLQFGVLSGECEDENDFLDKSKALIAELKQVQQQDLEHIFFDNTPKLSDLRKALTVINENIDKVKQIPLKNRSFTDWT